MAVALINSSRRYIRDDEYGAPQAIEARIRTETAEAAQALVAQFPKSLRLHPCAVSCLDGDYGSIHFTARLVSDANNGGINEAGLRRYRSFRKHLDRLGITAEWITPYGNSIATEAEFDREVQHG